MTAVSSPLADDGAARHLKRGRRLPDIALPTTAGRRVSFAKLPGRVIVYCYPWTGRPGLPNPPGWDDIAGAHGSTPQTEGFRNLHVAFRQVDTSVFGLSTQTTDYQQELVKRLEVPFELVSDADFEFAKALSLPTFQTGGVTYLKRLTLCLNEGVIERVYYPIDLPAAHAREVCAYLGMSHRTQ